MNELNFFMDISNPLFQLLISALLGAFVGLRRELELQQEHRNGFRGLRTTALTTVFGTVSTLFLQFPYLPILSFIGLLMGVILIYRKGLSKGKIGMTSEISLIIMFWSGVFIGYGDFIIGIILAIFIAISDAYKNIMHTFAKNLKLKEWSGTLQMIIITLIVLPFLPKKAIDPWGIFIPYEVWLLVVVVTAIGFIGYFLDKFFKNGKIKGVYLTSFLGSLISSTAVVVKLSQKVKKEKKNNSNYFVPAILLATGVMMFRDVVLILFASGTFKIEFLIIPISMGSIAFILFGVCFWKNKNNVESVKKIKLDNESPFEIIPSLKFAGIFVLVLFVVHFAKVYFGNSAVYLTASLVSLVDSETIILPVLESFKLGKLDENIIINILLIVLSINTLVKLFYIEMFAGKKYFWKTIIPIIIIVLSGFLGIFLV